MANSRDGASVSGQLQLLTAARGLVKQIPRFARNDNPGARMFMPHEYVQTLGS